MKRESIINIVMSEPDGTSAPGSTETASGLADFLDDHWRQSLQKSPDGTLIIAFSQEELALVIKSLRGQL
jgi:hypothetical protein